LYNRAQIAKYYKTDASARLYKDAIYRPKQTGFRPGFIAVPNAGTFARGEKLFQYRVGQD